MKKLICIVALLGTCALNSAGLVEKPMTLYNKTGVEWRIHVTGKVISSYRSLASKDKIFYVPHSIKGINGGFEIKITLKTPEEYKVALDGNELEKAGTAFDIKLDALGKLVVLPHEEGAPGGPAFPKSDEEVKREKS